MPPITHSNPLEHVLAKVFNATNADHPYCLGFQKAGIAHIDDLLALSKDDLESISWKDSSNVQESLFIGLIISCLIKHDISAFNSLKECCTFSYLLSPP